MVRLRGQKYVERKCLEDEMCRLQNRCHEFILVAVRCNLIPCARVPNLQNQMISWNSLYTPLSLCTWIRPCTLTFCSLISWEAIRKCRPSFWQTDRHEKGVTKIIITGDEAPDRNAISQGWMARSLIVSVGAW